MNTPKFLLQAVLLCSVLTIHLAATVTVPSGPSSSDAEADIIGTKHRVVYTKLGNSYAIRKLTKNEKVEFKEFLETNKGNFRGANLFGTNAQSNVISNTKFRIDNQGRNADGTQNIQAQLNIQRNGKSTTIAHVVAKGSAKQGMIVREALKRSLLHSQGILVQMKAPTPNASPKKPSGTNTHQSNKQRQAANKAEKENKKRKNG